jgi:hypothetical protein
VDRYKTWSIVKGLSRIFDLSIEPTALLQPIQNLERSIFRDCASLENSAGKLSESSAEISSAGLCFADSVLLKKSFSRSRSSIQFYFIISQARSTAACTDRDLLLNPPS